MQHIIKLFFSPLVFAIGFLWPLSAQILQSVPLVQSNMTAWILGALIATAFGLMAQFRGSWIWIK